MASSAAESGLVRNGTGGEEKEEEEKEEEEEEDERPTILPFIPPPPPPPLLPGSNARSNQACDSLTMRVAVGV